MSDSSNQEKQLETNEEFEALAVKDYLLDNPHFFNLHPELLATLQIPHQQKGSVSLVERQAEQLRDKVRKQQQELNELIGVAKQNEALYQVYADLNLRLCECKTLAQVQDTLNDVMSNRLEMSVISLKFFSHSNELPELQQKQFREKRFKQQDFYFGRLNKNEMQILFAGHQPSSVALVLLGEHKELGILAIGSDDAGHFESDMDHLFITHLQQCLNQLLPNVMDS